MKHTLLSVLALALAACSTPKADNPLMVDALPPLWPDYAGVTIPQQIAPLNFHLDSALAVDVTLQGADGTELRHSRRGSYTDFPMEKWRSLIAANADRYIKVTVCARYPDGWRQYRPFDITVSPDSIDYGLAYRLIAPGYEIYSFLGIYQRELGTYEQTPILENTLVDGCMNCHSFNRGAPGDMSLHVRGPHGATLLRKNGKMVALNTSTDSTLAACVYPYWHPSGRYIAYSTNNTRQTFHATKEKRLEVFDLASDVQIYDTETNELIVPKLLQRDSIWETFPAFSPDGEKLYFCAAKAVAMPSEVKEVRYDLCSVDFDAATGRIGDKIDTLVCVADSGHSIAFPRPSHDGRYLMYSQGDYGNFMIWHPESDLWLLDLASGETRPLDGANSDDAESYHSWSTNSRWFVMGTRRDDGLHTRPYICHINADGKVAKPFLLPQRNPRDYYDRQFRSYNIPEFITGPVDLDRMQAERVLMDTARLQVRPKIQPLAQAER